MNMQTSNLVGEVAREEANALGAANYRRKTECGLVLSRKDSKSTEHELQFQGSKSIDKIGKAEYLTFFICWIFNPDFRSSPPG